MCVWGGLQPLVCHRAGVRLAGFGEAVREELQSAYLLPWLGQGEADTANMSEGFPHCHLLRVGLSHTFILFSV